MQSSRDKQWLVYFASGNYWMGGITGRHHLLKRLGDRYNILFVNSLGLASIKAIKRNTILRRIHSKLGSYLKYLRRSGGFTIFSPVSIPLGLSSFEHFNVFVLKLQFKLVFCLLGIKKPHVLVANPKALQLLDCVEYGKVIYNYSDKFASYREISDREFVEELDRGLKERADAIISNLRKTYDDLCTAGFEGKSLYLPHSVDFNLFNSHLEMKFERPDDLKGISGPIIGYYGTLTDSNDWDLIEYLAEKRPDVQFVFIGKLRADVQQSVFGYSNIHFIDHKPYDTLPRYLKFFDACIMFWRTTDWIYNCNPLKTKEFFAMGKPVVSVKIYELEKNFSDIMYLCDTPEAFLSSIDRALAEKNPALPDRRIARVQNDSWENDAAQIVELLEGE